MIGRVGFSLFFTLFTSTVLYAQASSTIRGQIIAKLDRFASGIEITLKKSGRADSKTSPDDSGKYAFHDLENGRYDVVVRSAGKEVRQRVELVCGAGSTSIADIVLDKNDTPSLNVYFSLDDPDVVDVSELNRNYPKGVKRDFENAREEARAGNNARAVERLESVVKRAPDFYEAHAQLGMVYQNIGCFREARREYTAARELSPRSAQPLVNLGSLLIQAASAGLDEIATLDEARTVLREAIRIKPSSSIAYCLLGSAYFRDGAYEDAEENLKKALEFQGRMEAGRLMLANVYLRQEKWGEALEQLDAYLKDNPFAADYDQVKRIRSRVAENLRRK